MRYLGSATLFLILGFAISPQEAPNVKAVVESRREASGDAFCGTMLEPSGGPGMRTFTLALKGNRLATQPADARGWITDFSGSMTYFLWPRTQEYSAETFDQVRRKLSEEHAATEAADQVSGEFLSTTGVELPAQSRRRAKRFVYQATATATGRTKAVAGFTANEIELTVVAHEDGKTLERDGGWIATSNIWLGPRLAGIERLVNLQRRYVSVVNKDVYDAVFTEVEFEKSQFADPCLPEHVYVGARVIAETSKLDGSVLAATTTYDIERTAKEQERAVAQYDAQQRRISGSGARVLGGPPPKRSRIVTMEFRYVSISDLVADTDVSLPTGYRRK